MSCLCQWSCPVSRSNPAASAPVQGPRRDLLVSLLLEEICAAALAPLHLPEPEDPRLKRITSALGAAFPDLWRDWVRPARPGHVMLDLWAANQALLVRAGVDPRRIENPRLCTACDRDVFYSYRKGDPGRLVTVAALP